MRTQGSRGVRAAWKPTVFLVSQGFTRDGTREYDAPAGAEALSASLRAQHRTVCTLAVTMESVACEANRANARLTRRARRVENDRVPRVTGLHAGWDECI